MLKGLLSDAEALEWQAQGLCAHIDLAEVDRFFFPRSATPRAAEVALRVCAECPVFDQCREWTLTVDASVKVRSRVYGVCGGMCEQERARHQRMAQRPTCKGCGHLIRFAECSPVDFPYTFVAADENCTICRFCANAKKKGRRK